MFLISNIIIRVVKKYIWTYSEYIHHRSLWVEIIYIYINSSLDVSNFAEEMCENDY